MKIHTSIGSSLFLYFFYNLSFIIKKMNLSHWVDPLLSLLGQVQVKICQAMVQITVLLICYHSFLIHIMGTYFSNRCSRVVLESTRHQLLKHNSFELNIIHCIENCLLLWGSYPAQKRNSMCKWQTPLIQLHFYRETTNDNYKNRSHPTLLTIWYPWV